MAGALRGRFGFIAAIVLAFVMVVPINLLVGPAKNAEAAPGMTTLRIGFLQKVDSLNPHVGLNDASYVFYGLVYDTLMSVGNDLEVVPNLATSWYAVPLTDPEMVAHPSYPYGSVWQYNVTHDASWSDGEPFTADDVVFNINLNAGNYSSMWAYQPYSFFMKDAVKVDDYTVRIHFRDKITGNPIPAAYANMISIPMLPKHKLQSMTAMQIGYSWDGLFNDEAIPIVGTGPFMATSNIRAEYLAGTQLTLVRNPNYHWAQDRPLLPNETSDRWVVKFGKLMFYFYDDPAAMSYAIKNNQIDVAAFPPQEFNALNASHPTNMTFYSGPKITQYWTEIGFNMNLAGPNPSRLDHNIRQALAMATNKSYIVQNYYRGLADVGTTAIPPVNTYWHYEPNSTEKAQFKFDIAAANDLLNRSGYPRPAGDPSGIRTCSASSAAVTRDWVPEGTPLSYEMLIRRENPEERDIGLYMKQVWRSIGVNLDLWILDEATMTQPVYSHTYDTMIWYWSGDIDPNYQLFALSKKAWNGWSDNKWQNQSYEDNYTLSVQTMNKTLRGAYVDNAQRVHYLDAPYIIMAYPYQTYAWRTDTFTGWGDWAADPGRSIDNYWTGNPLWFDLVPGHVANTPPEILYFQPGSIFRAVDKEVLFTSETYDRDHDNLTLFVEFGDGAHAVQSILGTYGVGTCEFTHVYTSLGHYTVTLWADDGNGTAGHNVSSLTTVWIIEDSEPEIQEFTAFPDPVAAGRLVTFNVSAIDSDGDDLSYLLIFGDGEASSGPNGKPFPWHGYHIYDHVGDFTATLWVDDGNKSSGHMVSSSIVVHVVPDTPPFDLTIQISPNPAAVGSEVSIRAGANDTDIEGLSFYVEFGDGLSETIATAPGPGSKSVVFHHTYDDGGNYTVTVWVDDGNGSTGHNLSISASISVTGIGRRTVDYRWYDTFNVPFGPWYPQRSLYYPGAGYEGIWSDTYPYIYKYYRDSAHHDMRLYSNMRLNITARNLPEVNMGHPEFLPLFGSTTGGHATLNWHMQYMDPTWVIYTYGPAAVMYNDGWFVNLTGVTTLDKDAAMAVMGMTSSQFDNFDAYWASNRVSLRNAWAMWLSVDQANGLFDINNMYSTPMQIIGFGLHALKVGDKLVLTLYVDSWGMEALMARWLRDAFMPTEIWMEGFWMNATIGPQTSNIFIKTDVEYGVYAFTSRADGTPIWLWKPLHQDYFESSGQHPKSEFDPYARTINPDTGLPYTYVNWNPGSALYGTSVPYDKAPCAWNLSDNETMSFTWPAGMQQFELDAGPGLVTNLSSNMTIKYAEPMLGDYSSAYLGNGSMELSLASRTLTYVGPIDFWHWSQMQNAANHQVLRQQWIDIHGVMLPESTPWVEFGMDLTNASTPVARFTVTPTACNITTVLLFNASASSDPNEPSSNLSYRWDFDGNGFYETPWSYESTIQHQYSASGQFSPVLQVRNSRGYIGWVAGSVSVTDLPPSASFTVDPASGLQTQLFAFDASGSTDLEDAGSVLLVRWDWNGDGVWDTDWTNVKTASHQFSAPGTYTVWLQVRDSAGLVNVTTRQVTVLPSAIPEFPSVLIPILGMISLMVTAVALRNRRRHT